MIKTTHLLHFRFLALLAGCSLSYRMTHGDPASQCKAYEEYQRLSSEEQAEILQEIAEIAKTDTDLDRRSIAVARLESPYLLADVATIATCSTTRRIAVEKLTDQSILAQIAINDEDLNVRIAAIEKLTDPKHAC